MRSDRTTSKASGVNMTVKVIYAGVSHWEKGVGVVTDDGKTSFDYVYTPIDS